MPLALLLSPDDQAVSAITAVLEEMAVTCERPLDGASAAKQLNSHRFDLVLVDCENLPAAKLIFDVCRRGKSGPNPVPIAIVDGRAGLPTAFRLGAELILTKPVAKDQARSTIRTAVSRVKKEEPARQAQPAAAIEEDQGEAVQESSSQASSDETEALLTHYETSSESASEATPEPRALAATAAAVSSPLPQSSSAASTVAPAHVVSAPSIVPIPTASALSAAAPAADASHAPNAAPPPAHPKAAPILKPSDDPVLAEAEKTDADSQAPIFSSYPQKQRRTRKPLVALLVLALAAGGFYAAWMYEPGFRAVVQPQIDSVLALVASTLQSHDAATAPTLARPVPRPSPAPAAESAQGSQPAAASAAPNAPVTTLGAPANPAPAMPLPGAAAPLAQPAAPATSTPGIGVNKSGATATDANKLGANANPANQNSAEASNPAAVGASDAELPDEKTAVILSSKGAEKRLAHSVQPTYPAEARSSGAEGTVVLKAVIDENGKVSGARVVEGDATLARAAISAVKQWRYRPYVRDGKAQPFQTIVLVDFQRP